MGTLITLVYLLLSILSPAALFPSLAESRILVWLALAAMCGSVASVMERGVVLVEYSSLLVFGFISAVAMSWIAHGWLGGAFSGVQSVLPSVIMFFLVILNFQSIGKLRALAWVMYGATLYTVIAGLLAFTAGKLPNPYIYTSVSDTQQQVMRLRGLGFLNDPNDFGQQIVIVLALIPILAKGRGLLKVLVMMTVPLFLYAIYLTQSRGTLLGLVALMIALSAKRLGKFNSIAISVVLVVAFLAFGFAAGRGVSMTEASSANRMTLWGDGIKMFLHSPIFGAGYRSFADEAGQTAHNSFVLCFAELGLFGYVFWMTLLVLAFKQLKQALSAPPAPGADSELFNVATAFRNAMIVFLVTAWFLSRTYVVTIYLLCGAAQVILHLHQQKAPKPLFQIELQKVLALSGVLQFASVVTIYLMVRIHWFIR